MVLIHGYPCPVCKAETYGPHCRNCGWEDPQMLRARAEFMEKMMKPKVAVQIRRMLKRREKK